MADKKVVYGIAADNTIFKKKMKEVTDGFKGFGNTAKSVVERLKKNWVGMTVAIGGTVLFMKKAIGAYAIQEKAEMQLGAALKATGEYSKATQKDLEKYTSTLQKETTVGDEVSLGAMQLGLSMGISAGHIKDATKNAIGLSKAYGIDMKSAMKAVAEVQQGNFQTLGRYDRRIMSAKTNTEKMAIAQEDMANGFKLAQSETQTVSGKIMQMKNALGDAMEAIGGSIADVIVPFAGFLKKLAERFSNLPNPIKKVIVIMGLLGVAFRTLSIAFGTINPIMLGIAVAATSVIALINQIRQAKKEAFELSGEINKNNLNTAKQTLKGLKEQKKANDELLKSLKNRTKNGKERLKQAQEELQLVKDGKKAMSELSQDANTLFTLGDSEKFLKVIGGNAKYTNKAYNAAIQKGNELQKQIDTTSEKIKNFTKKINTDKQKANSGAVTNPGKGNSEIDSYLATAQTELQIENDKYAKMQKLAKDNQEILDKLKEKHAENVSKINAKMFKAEVQATQTALGQISGLMSESNSTLFNIGKAAAITNATISGYEAVAKTMASVPFPFNIPLAIAQGAASAVQIAKIASTQPPKAARGALLNSATTLTAGESGRELVLPNYLTERIINMTTPNNNATINFNINGTVIDDMALKSFTKKVMNQQDTIINNNEAY